MGAPWGPWGPRGSHRPPRGPKGARGAQGALNNLRPKGPNFNHLRPLIIGGGLYSAYRIVGFSIYTSLRLCRLIRSIGLGKAQAAPEEKPSTTPSPILQIQVLHPSPPSKKRRGRGRRVDRRRDDEPDRRRHELHYEVLLCEAMALWLSGSYRESDRCLRCWGPFRSLVSIRVSVPAAVSST